MYILCVIVGTIANFDAFKEDTTHNTIQHDIETLLWNRTQNGFIRIQTGKCRKYRRGNLRCIMIQLSQCNAACREANSEFRVKLSLATFAALNPINN